MCLSHLIYTVRPCLIHTCHAVPLPCHDHTVLKSTSQGYGRFAAGEQHGIDIESMNWHQRIAGSWQGNGMMGELDFNAAGERHRNGMVFVNPRLDVQYVPTVACIHCYLLMMGY
jgi:hypothetical protein